MQNRKERTAYRAALESTQVRHPWRATVRTVLWAAVAFSGMWALMVEAAGVDQTGAWVAASLTVTGAINRVMALPAVDAWLRRFVPWLASDPSKVPSTGVQP